MGQLEAVAPGRCKLQDEAQSLPETQESRGQSVETIPASWTNYSRQSRCVAVNMGDYVKCCRTGGHTLHRMRVGWGRRVSDGHLRLR